MMKKTLKIAFTFAILTSGHSSMAFDVNTGIILNDADAKIKCPSVCSNLQWNGHWDIPKNGLPSECSTTSNINVPIGTILDDADAKIKCPAQLAKITWNSQWTASACGCSSPPLVK